MASRFKYLPSVNVPYAEQGHIFFSCQTYGNQPKATREKINLVCLAAAGGEQICADALKTYMTTDRSYTAVCMDYCISTSTMDRMRRRFYQLYAGGEHT